jgi:hypothetical protein
MDTITRIAQTVHRKLWRHSSDVSKQTKSAQRVTKEWQLKTLKKFGDRVEREWPVSEDMNERIDLVDFDTKTAYELKVSENNTHFEFYRDIFKVLVHNDCNGPRLKKLVFVTPEAGAERIRSEFGQKVVAIARRNELKVEIVGI